MHRNNKTGVEAKEDSMIYMPHFEYDDLFQRLLALKEQREPQGHRRIFHSFDSTFKVSSKATKPLESPSRRRNIKPRRNNSAKPNESIEPIVRNNPQYSKKKKRIRFLEPNNRNFPITSIFQKGPKNIQ